MDVEQLDEKVVGIMLWDQNAFFLYIAYDNKKIESVSLTRSMGILKKIKIKLLI